jgi:cycloeucalenol cycloisomerase
MSLPIEITMTIILLSICGVVYVSTFFQKLKKDYKTSTTFLPSPALPAKREFEMYALTYTVIWIACFGVVIVSQVYEKFDEFSYMYLCVGLALPFLLQPIVFPLPTERKLPLFQRYSFKANVWIFIFGFVGNYWYTHYFYTVLKARYTFPAHRLNDVPISMFFATHFYFITYHTFSNTLLRYVESRYEAGKARTFLFWLVVIAFSYFTAFMETLSISNFPYYSFEDRYMAYTLGSAFYGIYFLASFPMFYRLDEHPIEAIVVKDKTQPVAQVHTLYQTIAEAMGCCMIVLLLLDFCRLACGIDLHISGVAYYVYRNTQAK